MKNLAVAALTLLFALPAIAEQKAYTRDPADLSAGYFTTLQRSPQLTPSVQPPAGQFNPANNFGSFFLEDDAGGTVTMTSGVWGSTGIAAATLNTTGFMGNPPGAYLWIRSNNTTGPADGQTAPGATTSQIDWGVLSGFTATGSEFCKSTPPALCTFIGRIEDGSQSSVLPSSTYDIGTWTFDGAGDFDHSGYIRGTQNGGISNTVTYLNGTFFGASLPALPLIGFGALALGLGIAGVRASRKS